MHINSRCLLPRLNVVASPANSKKPRALRIILQGRQIRPVHKQNCGDIIVRFSPFLRVHMGGIIMKTITLAVTTMLLLAAITMTAMPQSQTAYEKKSYNYAEWAKGRFSEVVTVRNAGTIIYLGGVGAEDENSAQGGAIRH